MILEHHVVVFVIVMSLFILHWGTIDTLSIILAQIVFSTVKNVMFDCPCHFLSFTRIFNEHTSPDESSSSNCSHCNFVTFRHIGDPSPLFFAQQGKKHPDSCPLIGPVCHVHWHIKGIIHQQNECEDSNDSDPCQELLYVDRIW